MPTTWKSVLWVTLMTCAMGSEAAVHRFITTMDVAQAIPTTVPVGTVLPGYGDGSLFYDDAGTASVADDTIDLFFTFAELTGAPSVAHIHKGAVGVSGGVALGLPAPFFVPGEPTFGGYIASGVAAPGGFLADLFAELLYVNVHTDEFVGGEIRGQLLFHSTVVPLPPALLMLGSALGLMSLRRRRS